MASRWSHRQSRQPQDPSTLPLDGGDDEDTDRGTDTNAPEDDNDDIASFATQQTTAIHTPSQ